MKINMLDYVLFDLETTGLSCDTDAIIEISAVKVSGGKITGEFSTLVNPGMHIPFMASSINGITDEMVEDAPGIEQALGRFVEFAGDYALVGHNITRFDMRFIQRDCAKYLNRILDNKLIDTLFLSRQCLPELASHSLESLARHYGISYEGAHRALADCRINNRVYECLVRDMENSDDPAKQIRICPKCGNFMKRREGRFGTFWGCRSYPDCTYTERC